MTNILVETGDLILTKSTLDIEDMMNIITKYSYIDKDQLKNLLEKN